MASSLQLMSISCLNTQSELSSKLATRPSSQPMPATMRGKPGREPSAFCPPRFPQFSPALKSLPGALNLDKKGRKPTGCAVDASHRQTDLQPVSSCHSTQTPHQTRVSRALREPFLIPPDEITDQSGVVTMPAPGAVRRRGCESCRAR